jgi:GNAT superfamily N-acetyltransferase
VAFVVADGYQHHGLGPILLERLVRRARHVGIVNLYAEILESNGPMLNVFRHSGYPVKSTISFGVVDVYLDISTSSTKDEELMGELLPA